MRDGRFLAVTVGAFALVAWLTGFSACLSATTTFPYCASAPMVHLVPGFLNGWAILAAGTAAWMVGLFAFRAI
ncbi:MAG TPA: hypothetical protein VJT33_10600 [bacterium]|nr:hypothetical protein [bacterium]